MFGEPTMSALLLVLFASGISAQCLTGNDNPPTMSQNAKSALIDARLAFAVDTLRKVAQIESRDNVFYSPHSLQQALTLAYFGARGTTETSLKRALRIPDELSKVDVQRYYGFENAIKQERDAQGNSSAGYEYTSANRLWITDARKLRECMFDFFGDQLEKADFRSNPSAVRNRVNDWVSNATKGHIRDLLPEDAVGEDTDLILANAVYFKGLWQSRFDPANSKKDLFYASGSQNSFVTFMRQKRSFDHMVSEELGAHVLELPYKGDEVSMFVLLPPFATARSLDASAADGDGIRHLVDRLSTERGAAELREILDDGMPPREVEVSLPRFELERELPVATLLRAMGAGEILAPESADLRGFVADGEPGLHLGDAVHRARIEVTEEGTTAAAATALFSFRSSRPSEPAVFNANHPFVYVIYDKPSRAVLFTGIYRTPQAPGQTAAPA